MPKGNTTSPSSSPTEPGRRTVTGLLLEILPLLKSQDPRSWESAADRLEEAAAASRRMAVLLDHQDTENAQPSTPSLAKALLETPDLLTSGPKTVTLICGSHVSPAFLGALTLHGRRG